ncbi:MAG TPA: hypothetical protein DCR69_03350 [Clostridium sp.]|nr:hypothetical protein [Clostridium sp.]
MNNKFDIKLNIPKGQIVSSLKEKIFQEELNNINQTKPLEENQINLAATYFLCKDNELEVGLFIRNTLKSPLSLKGINLAVQSSKGDIIATLQCNLKEIGIMPSCTGTPYSLKFTLSEGAIYNKDEEYEITFVNFDVLKGFSSVETEIENMPINMSFEEEEALLNFEKNLATLKKDEINISIFRSIKIDNGGIDITLLIRNGYNRDIKLERLPITIMNYNNYPICKHVFHDSNGLVNISAQRAKLLKLSIDKSKLYNTVFDLDRCKILFQ